MNSDKFVSLGLTLLPLLLKRGTMDKKDICELFAIKQRELEEFLSLVTLCGVPDYAPDCLIDVFDCGDKIELFYSGKADRPVKMNSDEAAAVLIACKIWANADAEWRTVIDTIANKVINAMGAAGTKDLAALLENITIDLNTDHYRAALRLFRSAIIKQRRVSFSYTARDGNMTERIVEPWRLCFHGGFWYLDSLCCGQEERRTFRIDRAVDIKILAGKIKSQPPKNSSTAFTAETFSAGNLKYEIIIECDSEIAEWLSNHYYAYDVINNTDGSARISFAVNKLEWLADELVPISPEIKIIEPVELTAIMLTKIKGMLAGYAL